MIGVPSWKAFPDAKADLSYLPRDNHLSALEELVRKVCLSQRIVGVGIRDAEDINSIGTRNDGQIRSLMFLWWIWVLSGKYKHVKAEMQKYSVDRLRDHSCYWRYFIFIQLSNSIIHDRHCFSIKVDTAIQNITPLSWEILIFLNFPYISNFVHYFLL